MHVTWNNGIDEVTGRPLMTLVDRYDVTRQIAIVEPGGQGRTPGIRSRTTRKPGWLFLDHRDQRPDEGRRHLPWQTDVLHHRTCDRTVTGHLRRNALQGAAHGDLAADRVGSDPGARGVAFTATRQYRRRHAVDGRRTRIPGHDKGQFIAYRADNGQPLWTFEAQTGVVAAASAFELDGEEYVAVEAGYGLVPFGMSNQSRLLVFKLNGGANLPPAPPPPPPRVLNPPPSTASQEVIAAGQQAFADHCGMCHDTSYANRGAFPDLVTPRRSTPQKSCGPS